MVFSIFELMQLKNPSLFQRIIKRLFGTKLPSMQGSIKDKNGNPIKKTRISNSCFIDHPEKLVLSQGVYIGHFNVLEASQGLTIEEGVQITSHCVITTHSSHHSIRLYGNAYAGAEMYGYEKGAVIIGKYSFIGPHSVIMPGTVIGKGSLIQAFSYVKGDFPDFAIIAGQPAQIIGDTRTSDKKWLDQYPELNQNYDDWAK